ncbi:enoyl-CoA hydratase/isomerase family protein [Rhodococcus sp. IEGM 248]|jgi:enoyl-CoA hydratase|uniref:Enoyl-CoA hydratase/isomerase family protein n=1 Tax=Rhodococcus opacus TaxID=37919 RepID=A0AAX3YTJ0_RHOOP|nr:MULTISPECIES: enoyl-CoA hydratase/isomerase family protein [Rhodococcus]NDV07258.1 enoyl-CoA hydratase/isomerase family protein [Rhodococcus sp. IEGM 248]RZK73501.1 MAG: enoyl-CoA hydratase/isomerase family protein [Rhodococcus sp. (in: high G+C Gram-positive bacteria)]MCZ4585993.1 enoyl-CoA hydratase/isomerase family protein [Rhodococcus opacus]QSE86247.1 enoyl-CoA hydratase/isomerase family protein [Rhodococcus koreensis]UOT03737.1 enoyl-CoA hydratase/isomerase family protein [Rhodococcus
MSTLAADDIFSRYPKEILIERKPNGVLLITINRPERLNSLTMPMFKHLSEIWEDVDRDPQTRVAVITGAGRGFCTGMDVRQPDPTLDDAIELMEDERRRIMSLLNMDKPLISAINGPAVGWGLSMALLADISVAAEDALLLDGHTRIGVVAGDHSSLIWPLLAGMAKTKYYQLTSASLTGAEAERIGLVSLTEPKDAVLGRALAIADDLAQGSQQAIRWTKRSLNSGWLTNALPQQELSAALETLNFAGADYTEARQAFREGRPAQFPSARRDNHSVFDSPATQEVAR